eukprot:gene21067-27947_t
MVGTNMTSEAQLGMPLDKLIEMNRSKFASSKSKGSSSKPSSSAAPKKGIRVGGARKSNITIKGLKQGLRASKSQTVNPSPNVIIRPILSDGKVAAPLRGGVSKTRGGAGGPQFAGALPKGVRASAPPQGNPDVQWQHDLFQDRAPARARQDRGAWQHDMHDDRGSPGPRSRPRGGGDKWQHDMHDDRGSPGPRSRPVGGEGKWQHDMHDDRGGAGPRPRPGGSWQHDLIDQHAASRPAVRRAPVQDGYKQDVHKQDGYMLHIAYLDDKVSVEDIEELFSEHIANLDEKVSDEDIEELFSQCGTLLDSKRIYKAGRFAGEAEVVYEREAHAKEAVRRFSGVALDGKKLVIKMVVAPAGRSVATLSSGIRVTKTDDYGAPRPSAPRSRIRSSVVRNPAGDSMEE